MRSESPLSPFISDFYLTPTSQNKPRKEVHCGKVFAMPLRRSFNWISPLSSEFLLVHPLQLNSLRAIIPDSKDHEAVIHTINNISYQLYMWSALSTLRPNVLLIISMLILGSGSTVHMNLLYIRLEVSISRPTQFPPPLSTAMAQFSHTPSYALCTKRWGWRVMHETKTVDWREGRMQSA